jgi:hypothetical protein
VTDQTAIAHMVRANLFVYRILPMIGTICLSLGAGACLSGCVTGGPHSPEVAAIDDKECLSYGAKPGSPEYISCRVTKNQQHESAMATVLAGGGGGGGPTTCQSYGNTTSCY